MSSGQIWPNSTLLSFFSTSVSCIFKKANKKIIKNKQK